MDIPYQKPSTTLATALPAPSESCAAPSATNSGAKCSVRGCATWAAGALCRKSIRESTSCAANARLAQSSNSVDQDGAGASAAPLRFTALRLCVVKPLPTTRTPWSRSGASLRPTSNSVVGSSVGIETCRTGMSASGYISFNGT